MSNFKIGEKVRIKYWNELPYQDDWNEAFFERHGGEKVEIQFKVGKDTFDVRTEEERWHITVGSRALKRDFLIPEHLFEIE